jgi:hypothetical protein
MAKEKEHKKAMSDGEVNDFAFKKLVGDLDGIEADGMFNTEKNESSPDSQSEGPHATSITGPGYTIEVKHNMDGQQTRAEPLEEDESDEDSDLKKLGK